MIETFMQLKITGCMGAYNFFNIDTLSHMIHNFLIKLKGVSYEENIIMYRVIIIAYRM